MRINELKKIAEENDYEFTKSPGDYKFTRKNRGNRVIYKFIREKRLWISFPTIRDEKDYNMWKAAVELAKTLSGYLKWPEVEI